MRLRCPFAHEYLGRLTADQELGKIKVDIQGKSGDPGGKK